MSWPVFSATRHLLSALGSGSDRSRLTTTLKTAVCVWSARTIIRIPDWENHIRFDPKYGRKRPCQDVLDRFRRLHNGMWIRANPGRKARRYEKEENFNLTHDEYMTCTKEQCVMLDKMMTPFWLRQRHYPDDPLAPYHTRFGIKSPRVDDNKRFFRERKKVLMDDLTADRYFDR